MIFGGGFWRLESETAREAAQRAIMHVQHEMENLVLHEHEWHTALCDRGIPDGLAYWPKDDASFWQAIGMTRDEAYARYYSVIHLRTPAEEQGYNHQNPLRTETAVQAAEIDKKIHKVWSDHPHYHTVDASPEFLTKTQETLDYILHDLQQHEAA